MVRYIWATTLMSVGLLWLILSKTDPSTINPTGILAVFFLIYTSLVGIVTYILFFGSKVLAQLAFVIFDTPLRKLTVGKAYIFSTVIAIGPVIIIAIRTVAELGIFDVILVLVFELIANFYLYRRM